MLRRSETSHLMKTLEWLVLVHLRPLVAPFMDPLRYAYQLGIGVDGAIIFLLDRSLSHLEKPGSTVRIIFLHLMSWILDYLTNRPQLSTVRGPHREQSWPLLFTLYTADFSHQSPHRHIQKISDDSAIVGIIWDGDNRAYRELIGFHRLVPVEPPPAQSQPNLHTIINQKHRDIGGKPNIRCLDNKTKNKCLFLV